MSIADFFEEAWDFIVDGTEYFFSFEWVGDAWEGIGDFFGSMFENIGEFSFMGLVFMILAVGVIYSTKFLNIDGSGLGSIESMTKFMPIGQRIVWTVLTYVGTGVAGYLLGNRFENT